MEYIEVKLVKCTVFLTAAEINLMLQGGLTQEDKGHV